MVEERRWLVALQAEEAGGAVDTSVATTTATGGRRTRERRLCRRGKKGKGRLGWAVSGLVWERRKEGKERKESCSAQL